ncbi:MAG: signal peptidase I [Vicinamibacteraceae bacterium]
MAEASYEKSPAREYFESIVIAVILALFVRTFVVQAFKIPSGSMEDNLLVGDHLLVNKFVYGGAPTAIERALLPVRDIRRGDVIVFKFPKEPDRDFIKRVIALPGETVELRRKSVYINGAPIDEGPFHLKLKYPVPPEGAPQQDLVDSYGPVMVPPDHLFVMGDNRDDSLDSRYWHFLPMNYVKGRAMTIYFSYDPDATGPASVITSIRWRRLLRQVH